MEVREVWQPWLKRKCNFVVRYIVPHRTNIMETMEGKKRFHAEVSFGVYRRKFSHMRDMDRLHCILPTSLFPLKQVKFGKTKHGENTATARLIFKPSLWERLQGKRDVVMKKVLDARYLFDELSEQIKRDCEAESKGNDDFGGMF